MNFLCQISLNIANLENLHAHSKIDKKLTRKNRQDLWMGFHSGRKSNKQDIFINDGSCIIFSSMSSPYTARIVK